MRLPFKSPHTPEFPRDWFETKSHAWEEAGLARQVAQRAARRARRQVLVLAPILAGILVAYSQRKHIGLDEPIRWVTVIALVIVGWAFARSIGEVAGPSLFRRMDPATAGTVGFLMRLVTVAIAVIVALRIAGLSPQSLAVGGAFTAVIVGLAAQQTLGNLIAGTVLLSARPFRVGERVRLQAGAIGGQIDGVVSSLGLLYTVLAAGEDRIMVPNSQVLSAVVIPRREPAAVDLRARLPHRIAPSEVQAALDQAVSVPTRAGTHIGLEEFDGDEVVVRIEATPERASDGPRLADEILAAVGELASNGYSARAARDQADERARDRHRRNTDGDGDAATTKLEREPVTTKLEREPATTKLEREPATTKLEREPATTKLEREPATTKLDPEPASTRRDRERATTRLDGEPATTRLDREPATTKLDREPGTTKRDRERATAKLDPDAPTTKRDRERATTKLDPDAPTTKRDRDPATTKLDPDAPTTKRDRERATRKLEPDAPTTKRERDPATTKLDRG